MTEPEHKPRLRLVENLGTTMAKKPKPGAVTLGEACKHSWTYSSDEGMWCRLCGEDAVTDND